MLILVPKCSCFPLKGHATLFQNYQKNVASHNSCKDTNLYIKVAHQAKICFSETAMDSDMKTCRSTLLCT